MSGSAAAVQRVFAAVATDHRVVALAAVGVVARRRRRPDQVGAGPSSSGSSPGRLRVCPRLRRRRDGRCPFLHRASRCHRHRPLRATFSPIGVARRRRACDPALCRRGFRRCRRRRRGCRCHRRRRGRRCPLRPRGGRSRCRRRGGRCRHRRRSRRSRARRGSCRRRDRRRSCRCRWAHRRSCRRRHRRRSRRWPSCRRSCRCRAGRRSSRACRCSWRPRPGRPGGSAERRRHRRAWRRRT